MENSRQGLDAMFPLQLSGAWNFHGKNMFQMVNKTGAWCFVSSCNYIQCTRDLRVLGIELVRFLVLKCFFHLGKNAPKKQLFTSIYTKHTLKGGTYLTYRLQEKKHFTHHGQCIMRPLIYIWTMFWRFASQVSGVHLAFQAFNKRAAKFDRLTCFWRLICQLRLLEVREEQTSLTAIDFQSSRQLTIIDRQFVETTLMLKNFLLDNLSVHVHTPLEGDKHEKEN